jgi:transposase
MPASPDTLLRMICATIAKGKAPHTPRVLGVDDWSWRRGHRYGTVLVDLEHNAVVDLLPDRQAETLAAWLRQHPGVKVIARDRAGAYADGARQGAPEAVQVADRWHLLRNLGDAVRALTDRHDDAVRRAAKKVNDDMAIAPPPPPQPVRPPTAAKLASQTSYTRRQARYEEAASLRAKGISLRRIAAVLGVERKTVRRWLRLGHAPHGKKPPRDGILAPYQGFLDQRWTEGCRNAAQLWREVVGLGFGGRPSTVRAWVAQRYSQAPAEMSGSLPLTPIWHPPPSQRIAYMLMAETETLDEKDRVFISHLLSKAPRLAEAISVAKRLHQLLRHKGNEKLQDVLTAAKTTLLAGFAASLQRDINAVQAALDLPWTTSPVEGQVNRIKMIKRTMYGRAGFDLLRARVLSAA